MSLSESELSAPVCAFWGKSSESDGAWLPLAQHVVDAGGVARLLMRDWVPASVRGLIARNILVTPDEPQVATLVAWLAAVHDIGKATPAFQALHAPLTGRVRDAGLPLSAVPIEAGRTPHSHLSHHVLLRWLIAHGWTREVAESYAAVVGGHHGRTTTSGDTRQLRKYVSSLVGTGPWRDAQDELLLYAAQETGAGRYLDRWSSLSLTPQVQAVVTGIVIVADWLASNRELFPYATDEVIDADGRTVLAAAFDEDTRLARGWDALSLPPRWRALAPLPVVETLFNERFDLPDGARPNSVQTAAVDLARTQQVPGILIIEAPMGSGKSEAALAVAEVYAARVGAGGVFVALPTMATSDALFSRVRRWVQRLPHPAGSMPPSMFLAHGKAALNDEYAGLARSYRLSGIGADGQDDVIAHWWLSGRKKGVLAPFVVGTIDQLLFAGLRSRHLVLRHLALAGKVVVVDEAHAYDAYMQTFLHTVLAWLGSYGVPVIVLSATLGSTTRRDLVAAYDAGRRSSAGLPPADDDLYEELGGDIGYPVLSGVADGALFIRSVPYDGPSTTLHLAHLSDDLAALVATVEGAVTDGGCVAVLRNTVSRAQEAYDALLTHLGEERLMLVHSRFIACDRATMENRLRRLLGPPGSGDRPHGFVVVGTQVLEQSLDIDVDLMVSDVAPTDLLLQRAGRLHRHNRQRPPALSEAWLFLTGVVDWAADDPVPVRPSRAVYDPYVLARTLRVLRDHGDLVTLPDDIAGLVERTYRDTLDHDPSEQELRGPFEARRLDQERRASIYALKPPTSFRRTIAGWENINATDDESLAQAAVRDSEDTLEVAVLVLEDGEASLLPWVGGGARVATEHEPDPEVARLLATCTVRLPAAFTRWREEQVIDSLDRYPVPGWQQSRWLRDLPPLFLSSALSASVAGHTVRYDRHRGLTVTPEEAAS